ncbi:MAG: hypothetical protein ABSD68_00120 [Candidatus Micrarchaeales archaeon]|jgi:hypothetical protein
MGLDVLGDAYWIDDYGKRLVTAVTVKDIEGVKEVLKEATTGLQSLVLFHKDADKALISTLERSLQIPIPRNEQIAEVLVENFEFMDSLSYQGLVRAEEYAKSLGNNAITGKISEILGDRKERIGIIGVMAYLKEIRNKTVTDASGDKVMLGTLGDAVAFAVDMSDVSNLMKLARWGMHDILDEETLGFVKERIKKKEQKTREMVEFVVESMVERKLVYNTLTEIKRSNSDINVKIKRTRDMLASHS